MDEIEESVMMRQLMAILKMTLKIVLKSGWDVVIHVTFQEKCFQVVKGAIVLGRLFLFC